MFVEQRKRVSDKIKLMQNKISQIKTQLVKEIKGSKLCESWFYQEHLLVVEKLTLNLCKLYPKANKNAVTLSVWFHDIGRANGHDENHDLYGANYAKKILTENNFDENLIDLVVNSCKTHSCDKNGKPKSLEGKILATADALSHYHNGFYLRILHSWSKKIDNKHYPELTDHPNFPQLRAKLFKKMKRDLDDKIFFDEVRKKVMPMYEAWQKVIGEVKLK